MTVMMHGTILGMVPLTIRREGPVNQVPRKRNILETLILQQNPRIHGMMYE